MSGNLVFYNRKDFSRRTMELKMVLLLCLAVGAFASPAKMSQSDDLMAAEGRSLHSYAAPAHSSYGGGATVTSYNRRGSYAQSSDVGKPSIYGNSYGAPQAIGAAPAPYHAAPVRYAPAPVQRYAAPPVSPHSAPHGYGPQRNAFSEQSQRVSQDPHYDPAKDPVSQYAQYVPVFEYAPKSQSHGNELSIYGYRK